MRYWLAACSLLLWVGPAQGCKQPASQPTVRTEEKTVENHKMPFPKQDGSALLNNTHLAIAYSGFREGQHPDRGSGSNNPTRPQIEEDLKILIKHGIRLIRLYGAGENSKMVLEVIRDQQLPIKVVQGIWLSAEVSTHGTCRWVLEPVPQEKLDANRAANLQEIERGIALAKAFETEIVGVNVGNEALVDWNDHRVTIETMVKYMQKVKGAIVQPITTADAFGAWERYAKQLQAEVDFAFVHSYPVWMGEGIETAMASTEAHLSLVRKALPELPIAVGEAGWATTATEFAERASHENQATYVSQLLDFGKKQNVSIFVFEAFDESWKGGPDPNGAEKHWGLFYIDRTPKPSVASGKLLPVTAAEP